VASRGENSHPTYSAVSFGRISCLVEWLTTSADLGDLKAYQLGTEYCLTKHEQKLVGGEVNDL
jgi:hypothetical protein